MTYTYKPEARLCRECGTRLEDIEENEIYHPCEICGDHLCYKCPECGEEYTLAWDWDKLEVVE